MWHVCFDKTRSGASSLTFRTASMVFTRRPWEALHRKRRAEDLVFATDDEWLIHKDNMELVRVHKKTGKVKYEPKAGQTPIPSEFLDSQHKTIMDSRNKVVTQEDDWRASEVSKGKPEDSTRTRSHRKLSSRKGTGKKRSPLQGKRSTGIRYPRLHLLLRLPKMTRTRRTDSRRGEEASSRQSVGCARRLVART